MNILICDDERAYVNDIKNHVELFMDDHNYDTEIDTFYNGEELLKNCGKKYDIAFLDIEIGNVKGTDVAVKLKEANKNIIIFIITAYDKYLDEAMDLDVLRFIVKPLDAKRLYSGLEKAINLIDDRMVDFYLKYKDGAVRVSTSDIIYVEIFNRATKVVTTIGEFMSREKINYWENNLVASYFFKVHTSFIINMKYITKYERDIVELNNSYLVPVAYRTRSKFKNYFINYFGGV